MIIPSCLRRIWKNVCFLNDGSDLCVHNPHIYSTTSGQKALSDSSPWCLLACWRNINIFLCGTTFFYRTNDLFPQRNMFLFLKQVEKHHGDESDNAFWLEGVLLLPFIHDLRNISPGKHLLAVSMLLAQNLSPTVPSVALKQRAYKYVTVVLHNQLIPKS